ncbi:unnamed protein product [[Candida] boidinii]|nr:unnamed protein product [[Candida] boidinii]
MSSLVEKKLKKLKTVIQKLKLKMVEIDPSDHEVYDRLLSLVEDLITSLNHGDADSELIELLYSIFKYYQLTKLERYSLEYMITSNSSELSVSNSNNMNFSTVGFENEDYTRILESIKNNTCRFLMPNLSRTLNQYTKLLKKIGILDDNNVIMKKLKRFGNYLPENKFICELESLDLDFIKFDEIRNLTELEDTFLEFKVENKKDVGIEWDDFIYQLNECLPRYRGKTKIYDNYILTKSPIEGLKIKVNFDEDIVKLDKTVEKVDVREQDSLNPLKYTDEEEKNGNSIDKQSLEATKDSSDNIANEDPVSSLDLDNTTTSQRVSKRLNRTRNETVIPQIDVDTFKTQERVFNTLNQYLEDLNDQDERNIGNFKITNILPLVFKDLNLDAEFVEENGENEKKLLINDPYLYDFWVMLQNWGDDQTEVLLASADIGFKSSANSSSSRVARNKSNSTPSNSANGLGVTSVREILNSTGLNEKAIESKVTLDELDKGQLNKLIEKINKNKMHFTQIRILVVSHLLKFREETGGSLLTDSKIREETQNLIGVFIDACGMYYFKSCKANLLNDTAKINIEIFSVCISIYEYLINAYISMIQERKIKNLKSSAMNELVSLENTLLYRIKNWETMLNDIFQVLSINSVTSSPFDVRLNDTAQKLLWYRFSWASLLVLQHQDVDPSFLKSKLQNLTTRIEFEQHESSIIEDDYFCYFYTE